MKKINCIIIIVLLFVTLFTTEAFASGTISSDSIEKAIKYANNEKSTRPDYWKGYCAAFVWSSYHNGAGLSNSSYATAREMGDALITHTDANPPRGALVFWYKTSDPYGHAGHVGLSLGDGTVIHAFSSLKISSISTVNNNGYTYRGWGSPISGYTLETETTPSHSDYENTWHNTGNMAVDLAEVAYTQIGYHETGTNHTKYNQWYYGNDTAAAWCAIFVSWCANQAGIPQSIIHRTPYAYPGSDDFNIPYYRFSSVQPAKGDLVFVENNGNLNYGGVYGFDHVGIVYSVDSSYIYTVEGNDHDQVTYNKYRRSDGVDIEKSSAYIVWIGKPNYSGSQPEQLASTLGISGYEGKPGTPGTAGKLTQGENYGLRGVISSNYAITQVTAHIYNSNGWVDALSPYSTSWSKTSYDIRTDGINNAFSFAQLPAGNYRYVVSAADESGLSKTLIHSDFEVVSSSQPVVIPTGTIAQKLASILAEYPDGSTWTQTFDGSQKSYGFAGLVVYKIFGNSTVSGKTYRWWTYAGVSTSGMQAIGEVASCTADNVRGLLASARPGDVLQFDKGSSTGTQFSMVVYSLTDSGAYIYDCNLYSDNVVRLHHMSYSDFVALQGTGPKGKLTLLRSDNYDTIEPPVQTTMFDLNGCLDGSTEGSIDGYGTVDIYINGNLAAQNVGDYYEALPVGTTYEIKNIQALDGHVYLGAYSGTLTGTIGTERTEVYLSFNTLSYLNMDGYLDGVANDGMQQYGTADIYVNGILVGSGWNDYWAAWPYGSSYEIKNICANDGYRYNGVRSGALSGTIGKDRIDVVLSFSTVHTYSFDANGDFGTMAPIHVALGDPITFPACSFEREGYSFQGWEAYRVNDGKYGVSGAGWRTLEELEQQGLTKTVYPDGLSFTFNTSWTEGITGPSRIILYAVWKADTYTISYNANGGVGAPSAQEKTYAELMTLSSSIPTREGYYFLGWATSVSEPVPEYQPGGLFTLNANTTLYAVWDQADFVLPTALTIIEEEAFANCAFRFVKLSENVSEIQYHAFDDCPNLAYIYIPASVTDIDPQAFGNMTALTVIGERGSTAETFANAHGFAFLAG